jgi:hypothetical protein
MDGEQRGQLSEGDCDKRGKHQRMCRHAHLIQRPINAVKHLIFLSSK